MTIPTIFREPLLEECGGKLTITLHLHVDCLVVYKRQNWEKIEEKFNKKRDASIQFSDISRRFIGNGEDIQVDKTGRILIPRDLRDKAFLKKKVTVIGLGTLLEIWDTNLLEKASKVKLDTKDPEVVRITKLLKL